MSFLASLFKCVPEEVQSTRKDFPFQPIGADMAQYSTLHEAQTGTYVCQIVSVVYQDGEVKIEFEVRGDGSMGPLTKPANARILSPFKEIYPKNFLQKKWARSKMDPETEIRIWTRDTKALFKEIYQGTLVFSIPPDLIEQCKQRVKNRTGGYFFLEYANGWTLLLLDGFLKLGNARVSALDYLGQLGNGGSTGGNENVVVEAMNLEQNANQVAEEFQFRHGMVRLHREPTTFIREDTQFGREHTHYSTFDPPQIDDSDGVFVPSKMYSRSGSNNSCGERDHHSNLKSRFARNNDYSSRLNSASHRGRNSAPDFISAPAAYDSPFGASDDDRDPDADDSPTFRGNTPANSAAYQGQNNRDGSYSSSPFSAYNSSSPYGDNSGSPHRGGNKSNVISAYGGNNSSSYHASDKNYSPYTAKGKGGNRDASPSPYSYPGSPYGHNYSNDSPRGRSSSPYREGSYRENSYNGGNSPQNYNASPSSNGARPISAGSWGDAEVRERQSSNTRTQLPAGRDELPLPNGGTFRILEASRSGQELNLICCMRGTVDEDMILRACKLMIYIGPDEKRPDILAKDLLKRESSTNSDAYSPSSGPASQGERHGSPGRGAGSPGRGSVGAVGGIYGSPALASASPNRTNFPTRLNGSSSPGTDGLISPSGRYSPPSASGSTGRFSRAPPPPPDDFQVGHEDGRHVCSPAVAIRDLVIPSATDIDDKSYFHIFPLKALREYSVIESVRIYHLTFEESHLAGNRSNRSTSTDYSEDEKENVALTSDVFASYPTECFFLTFTGTEINILNTPVKIPLQFFIKSTPDNIHKKMNLGNRKPAKECCILCLEATADACFVHGKTGHNVCCMPCATRLHRSNPKCPICREKVQAVIQIFRQ